MKAKHSFKAAWLLVIILFPSWSWAQGLTEQQYTLLQTDITITHASEFATLVAAADYQALANAYNLQAAPVFWVWKTSLSEKEVYEATVEGQSWNWTTYIGQSVQERDGWALMNRPGTINPSLPQVRGAFDKIFAGTGASATQRTYLLTVSRREALRNEALFANTSAGSGTTAAPATTTHIGPITYYDVYYALTGVRP